MTHRLTVDFRSGVFVASCSCGGWATDRMPQASERSSDVYDQIEQAHRRHVERDGRLPPSRPLPVEATTGTARS